jgi:flagellin
LTFTGGTGGATQDQVRAAFASIAGTSTTNTKTAAEVSAAANALVSDTIGRFTSGTTITGGTFAAGVGNGTVTWTAAAGSNTQNTTSLTISSTGTVAVPTVSVTQASSGTAPQIQRIAFADLKAGESIKLSGLTFTSGTAGTTKEQLKAIFVGIAGNGATKTFTEVNAIGGMPISEAIGRFTFGTHNVAGTYSSDTGPGEVKITAAAVNTSLTLNASGTAAAPTATVNTATTPTSVFAIGQASAPTSKSTETVTFQALGVGQSVTVNGLTFTPTVAMTNAQVAAAFSSVLTGETAAQVTARNTASALIGTYTGTNTAGYASTTVSSTNQVVYTSVNDAAASFGKPTAVGTPGKAPQPQVSTATFTALEAGASVTFAGLTFTSGTAGTTADQLKAAFAKVAGTSATTGQTFTQVNTTAGTDVSDSIGRFTSGTAITGGTFAAGGGTGQVTWTASTNSDTQIALASTGSMESTVVTFSALKTGQSFNLNGLGFTAKKDLTSAEVASAFGSLTSGTSTTPANTANGNYSGSWAAGYSTAAASGATVKATATVAGTADIVFTSSKSVTTQGITVPASTVYGTVTLNSQNTFTIKPGAKAYATAGAPAVDPTYANFTALGFEAKTINAKNIGRLNFQVGPAANQLISIDLADFGKNGDITGLITSDRAPTNLLTVNSSNDVIMNVNKSLDRIAATRATMGAVMNRLEHVINNLTNVVMNSEASRSQIEDADYAQASTELARTQIMQQAATAVLAQANTSQQTVLKLLQG